MHTARGDDGLMEKWGLPCARREELLRLLGAGCGKEQGGDAAVGIGEEENNLVIRVRSRLKIMKRLYIGLDNG